MRKIISLLVFAACVPVLLVGVLWQFGRAAFESGQEIAENIAAWLQGE